jgi:hypothetical protein
MITIRNSSRLFIMPFLIIMLMLTGVGCKSKKKAMEAAAAEKARMEQQAALDKQRADEEAARKRDADEKARREREASANNVAPKQKLDLFFNAIANSGSAAAANNSINEALSLFASPETPVLIVISEEAGQKDYDRPTTIRDYLNYLKDQKKNANKISNLQFDSDGKITEVELSKQ